MKGFESFDLREWLVDLVLISRSSTPRGSSSGATKHGSSLTVGVAALVTAATLQLGFIQNGVAGTMSVRASGLDAGMPQIANKSRLVDLDTVSGPSSLYWGALMREIGSWSDLPEVEESSIEDLF